MKIIISPAKKMRIDDGLLPESTPYFIKEIEKLREILLSMSYEELRKLWKCNDKIASENYELLHKLNPDSVLTPAVLAYDGIQYKHMAPGVFDREELEYIKEHLFIISGLYGILRAFDGIIPYRLEMQAKLKADGKSSLYDYWGPSLAEFLSRDKDTLIDLASKEYSSAVLPYYKGQVISCSFAEMIGGKPVEKGTLCKMARGEMVRFMAEVRAGSPEDLRNFCVLGYRFSEELSEENKYIFIKEKRSC